MADYEFRRIPINAKAMEQLIVELFQPGMIVHCSVMIAACEAEHLRRGGFPAKNVKSARNAFKKASVDLREARVIEQTRHRGYWSVIKRDDREELKARKGSLMAVETKLDRILDDLFRLKADVREIKRRQPPEESPGATGR